VVVNSPSQASIAASGLPRDPSAPRTGSQASSCPRSPPPVQLLQMAMESVPQNGLGFGGVHNFMDEIGARLAAIYRASCANS
jgi:hypothetical protein